MHAQATRVQAQLNTLLGLHRTNSSVSIDSVTSFARSINTKKAFKELCQNLYHIGVRADLIKEKESEILNIFKPQNTATSSQIDDNNTTDTTGSRCMPVERSAPSIRPLAASRPRAASA